MSDLGPQENWQVEVNGQVYEANIDELVEWIGSGALQPEDKIRRGNLRWIEAQKVSILSPHFSNKAIGVAHRVQFQTTAAVYVREDKSGLGLADLGHALFYPFRFKTSLVVGALMFMFFAIGRAAFSLGGIHMIAASMFSMMLANMLAFGVLSNTLTNFSQGKIGGNFMPAFEDFSLWDDVIHPFFVSVGIYVSSFGTFLMVFLIAAYFVSGTVNSQLDTVKTNLEQSPGTPYYSGRDTLDQSDQVKSVLSEAQRIERQRLSNLENAEAGLATSTIDQQEDVQRIDRMIADSHRQELEAVIGRSPATKQMESAATVAGFFNLAAPIVVAGFFALLWGLFYFPAACIVAGYTQSFNAAINPVVGLDTIRRMGTDYFKLLLIELLLLIGYIVTASIISLVLSPFEMPGFGNIPALAVESLIWFYLVVVFACVLGFAMFKRSDRL